MTAQPKQPWTVEAYLAFERASETKHEYYDGEIFAMADARAPHNIITVNLIASLQTMIVARNHTITAQSPRSKNTYWLRKMPSISSISCVIPIISGCFQS